MPTATFNGTVIAQSDDTVVVEGNHYFPPDSLVAEHLVPSDHQTVCGWKGTASYYAVEVDGQRAENGAWTYPDPLPAATEITDYVAFYRNQVNIED